MRTSTHLYKKFNCAYFLIFCIVLQTTNVNTATIVVESEDDSGVGTLRDAITNAANGDTIAFDPTVQLIQLSTPLPPITQDNLIIDGLAEIVGTDIIPGDCSAFPSPVENENFFSAALRVSIDGSNIPKNTADRGIGLDVRGSEVTIRGLRIQNFNGRLESSGTQGAKAVGITSASNSTRNTLPTIECCEIKNLVGGTAVITAETRLDDAFGIEKALLINKCLIHDINTFSYFGSNKIVIGRTAGILDAQTITDCSIQNITRGSVSAPTVAAETASGILMITSVSTPILVEHCVIKNVSGGSIEFEPSDLLISFVDTVSGISQTTEDDLVLNSVTICNVNANDIIVNTVDTSITINPVQGMHCNNDGTTTINNSCITKINGYNIEVQGENNIVNYSSIVGINASSQSMLITNNIIDAIKGNNITVAGDSNTAALQQTNLLINCIPFVPFSALGIEIITNKANKNSIVTHNRLQNIRNGTHQIQGSNAILISTGSAGIGIQRDPELISEATSSLVTNNTIYSIIGPDYYITSDDAQTLQLNGTTGIYTDSFKTRIADNDVKKIHEGTMKPVSNNSVDLYALPLGTSLPLEPLPSREISFLPTYTSGITALGNTDSVTSIDMDTIIIKNNMIKDIKGSHVKKSGASLRSYAVGIIAQPSLSQVVTPKSRQLSQCDDIIGFVSNNVIDNLQAYADAASYGILIDGSNVLLTSAIVDQGTPFVDSKLLVQENTITTLSGAGTVAPLTLLLTNSTLIPFLPSEPTSGIFTLFGGCSPLKNNTISDVHAPLTRGITTVASSDMDITENTIFKTDGPGIFVGGASADPIIINSSGVFDQQEFEEFFPSVHNTIYSNSTYANSGEGIELGVINWNNFFTSVPLLNCTLVRFPTIRNSAKGGPIEIEVIGNHDQPAPYIMRVVCNRNGTITIEIKFSDPDHPNSEFIIQFFRNNSNGTPHGEQLISNFDNPYFTFTTDENGKGRKTFTFVPAAKVEPRDIISVHATLSVDGSIGSNGSQLGDIGDTSEFRTNKKTDEKSDFHLQKNSGPSTLFCHRK